MTRARLVRRVNDIPLVLRPAMASVDAVRQQVLHVADLLASEVRNPGGAVGVGDVTPHLVMVPEEPHLVHEAIALVSNLSTGMSVALLDVRRRRRWRRRTAVSSLHSHVPRLDDRVVLRVVLASLPRQSILLDRSQKVLVCLAVDQVQVSLVLGSMTLRRRRTQGAQVETEVGLAL